MFVFEVHQPHRLRRNLFWEGKILRRMKKKELFDYYFDNEVDREIFSRAARTVFTVAFLGGELRAACDRDPALGYALMKRLMELATERLDLVRLKLTEQSSAK